MFTDVKKAKKKTSLNLACGKKTEIAEGQDCSHGLIDFQPSARMNVEKTSYVSPVKFFSGEIFKKFLLLFKKLLTGI